jgi:hypothetical protein
MYILSASLKPSSEPSPRVPMKYSALASHIPSPHSCLHLFPGRHLYPRSPLYAGDQSVRPAVVTCIGRQRQSTPSFPVMKVCRYFRNVRCYIYRPRGLRAQDCERTGSPRTKGEERMMREHAAGFSRTRMSPRRVIGW